MGMFDSKPEALTSAEMAAGAGRSLGNTFGDVIPGYQSKEQQVVSIMQTVDHSNLEEVKQAYNQILQVSPEAAAEYLTQAKEFLDQRTKATTPSSNELKAGSLLDSLAYLESISGTKLTGIEKKQFLARSKDKVSVGEWGVVDTAKNVFNSILSNRSMKSDSGKPIPDTELSGASMDKQVSKLSKSLSDTKIADMDVSLQSLEDVIASYRNEDGTYNDIPGFSILEKPFRTEEGSRNSMLWENVTGILRHEKFGTALTANEQKNFEKMKSGDFILNDNNVRTFVEEMRKLINRKKEDTFAGYSNEIVNEYNNRLGRGKKVYQTPQSPQQIVADAKKGGWNDARTNFLLNKYFPNFQR